MSVPSVQDEPIQKRPGLLACLRSGFDAIANHVGIVLFPVAVDLILWLGPHFRIKTLFEQGMQALDQVVQEQGSLPPDAVEASRQMWQTLAERFNLLGLLRTIPVGLPSLMAGRSPIETPLGAPVFFEISNFSSILLLAFLVLLLGLSLGAFYFLLVAQLSTSNELDWLMILRAWPRATLRSIGLTLMLLAVLVAVTIPFSCLLGLLALSGLALSQIGSLLYGVILAWWLFPLIFAAHGIFLYQEKVWPSIRRSIRLTRLTFPITGSLLLIILVLSEGLDFLWNTPQENSWLMLLGVAGHAFVTTALLATSFVYYRDMNGWLHRQHLAALATSNPDARI